MESKRGNKIRKIFKDHWEEFYNRYDNQIRPVVKAEVEKMLKCMDIEYGYTEFK